MKIGVVYFVIWLEKIHKRETALDYFKYAIRSARSFKEKMPWLPLTLFTNMKEATSEYFDQIICNEETVVQRWEYKYRALLNSPYDVTLHVDADTYVAADFSDVFELMKHFDLALTMSVWHMKPALDGVPRCFPEPAGGMMIYKKCSQVYKLFEKMEDVFAAGERSSDEPQLRKYLYSSDVRFVTLPWEYNCVLMQPGYLYHEMKIAHGRIRDIVSISDLFNKKRKRRLFTGESLILLNKKRKKQVELGEIIKYDQYLT